MLSRSLNLILYRTAAELRSEGARTYAGYLWWIFDPLMSLGVYYVAFKYIFHRTTENFAIFLFTGLVIYRFFSQTAARSAGSILSGKGLMNRVYIHKSIFPLSVVAVNLVKFLITLILLVFLIWLAGITPTWTYLAMPALIIMQLLITTGVAMICAAITPFFPDFQLILSTFLHLLIFLSGVFYDISTLSPRIQSVIQLNPLAVLIQGYRAIMLYGQWPRLEILGAALVESVLAIMIGWFMIHKFNRYYPKIS